MTKNGVMITPATPNKERDITMQESMVKAETPIDCPDIRGSKI
jgi:hypothetical protein